MRQCGKIFIQIAKEEDISLIIRNIINNYKYILWFATSFATDYWKTVRLSADFSYEHCIKSTLSQI